LAKQPGKIKCVNLQNSYSPLLVKTIFIERGISMNKTLIALAIVAALPVAAQADATISGSVNTKYKFSQKDIATGADTSGGIDTDARLSIASSEVLANGMTATAGFAILADTDDDTENSGTASLAGDFGTLTVGSIDSDAAFQAGDVAGVVDDTTYSTSSTAASVYGIHYAGSVAGVSVASQVNANTGASGGAAAIAGNSQSGAQTKSTQLSATYEINGLTVGYSYASAQADADSVSGSNDGIHEGQSAFGASYAFGDLVVSAGKVNLKDSATSPDTVISATYTMNIEGLDIVAQVDNYHSATDSSDYQVNLSYALTDAITLSSEIDKSKTTTMVATYTAGDLTAMIAKRDDDTTDASISLNYGNAVLSVGRVGERAHSGSGGGTSAEYSHISYKVTF
jgi:hypothetical protein